MTRRKRYGRRPSLKSRPSLDHGPMTWRTRSFPCSRGRSPRRPEAGCRVSSSARRPGSFRSPGRATTPPSSAAAPTWTPVPRPGPRCCGGPRKSSRRAAPSMRRSFDHEHLSRGGHTGRRRAASPARGAGLRRRARRAGRRRRPAAAAYLLGGTLGDGTAVTPKYVGPRRLIEVAVATLATDRALLLLGLPGTAKTWVSEHLAAAICADSTLLVQGTSGTAEEAIRYGWNYARLIAEGPSPQALVPSPVMTAMRAGKIVRIEELTRMPAEVQDALITVLSEKTLPVPELGAEVQAIPGFTLIATANDRDRGVNEMSSALKRRFNTVVLPLPATADTEVEIVSRRVAELGR